MGSTCQTQNHSSASGSAQLQIESTKLAHKPALQAILHYQSAPRKDSFKEFFQDSFINETDALETNEKIQTMELGVQHSDLEIQEKRRQFDQEFQKFEDAIRKKQIRIERQVRSTHKQLLKNQRERGASLNQKFQKETPQINLTRQRRGKEPSFIAQSRGTYVPLKSIMKYENPKERFSTRSLEKSSSRENNNQKLVRFNISDARIPFGPKKALTPNQIIRKFPKDPWSLEIPRKQSSSANNLDYF